MLSISHQDFKTASTKMSSELKDAGITIQHSKLLEMMAHAFGYKNYATFKGLTHQPVSRVTMSEYEQYNENCKKFRGLIRLILAVTNGPRSIPLPAVVKNINQEMRLMVDGSEREKDFFQEPINSLNTDRDTVSITGFRGDGDASYFKTDGSPIPVKLTEMVTKLVCAKEEIKKEMNEYAGRGNIFLSAAPGRGKSSIIDGILLPKVNGRIACIYGMTPYQHMRSPTYYTERVTWFTLDNFIEFMEARKDYNYKCVVIDDLGEFKMDERISRLLSDKGLSVIVSCQSTNHTAKEIESLFDVAYFNPDRLNPECIWSKTYPQV